MRQERRPPGPRVHRWGVEDGAALLDLTHTEPACAALQQACGVMRFANQLPYWFKLSVPGP